MEVLTHSAHDNTRNIRRRVDELGPVGNRIRPHVIPVPPYPSWVGLLPGTLKEMASEFFRYRGWQRLALDYARSRGLDRTDLIHHVSYGSLEGACELRRLGPPLVFGPVGGGQTAPHSHRRYLGRAYWQEALRTQLWVRGLSLRSSCRATIREAAAVLTTNRDTEQLARRLGRTDSLMMLADGVQETLIRPQARSASAKGGDPPTILWVGKLIPRKAPALALRTFALLRSDVPEARLVIVGDGPLRFQLERLSAQLGVHESVHFRGRLPWEQALRTYDNADAFLMTSLRDSFGLQALEAWARGLPVVHLDHQGIRDYSAPGGAIRVPLGDPADLPHRLAQALGNMLGDQQVRRRMGGAGVAWARQHTWAVKAEAAEKLYHSVLASGRSSTEAVSMS
ncbi:glycosyltransferase family 4 protein [Streptomyces sp. PSKA28]|uniref:Glycosyltransferase family 4 protein n=1 Tax=Streptomyces himalayensis subsp. himalayensis TaxID=2756131 RepID=A0A7W0DHN0_9ACTN|nr:glycosyltransferase family 4 protein [Streptomyces himalayensis subsp. himalayensis]